MPPSANHRKGIIMLRSIGSVTFLARFMVGCGGGGGGSGAGGNGTTYSIGGSVTGLTGSGLGTSNEGASRVLSKRTHKVVHNPFGPTGLLQ